MIADSSGNLVGNAVYKGSAGTATGILLSTGNMIFTENLAGSTSADAAYIVVPYDCYLVGARADIRIGTTGTGVTLTAFLNDTAGTALFGSCAVASAGTPGQTTYTLGTMSTAVITQGSTIAIIEAASATACGMTVTVTCTKAGN